MELSSRSSRLDVITEHHKDHWFQLLEWKENSPHGTQACDLVLSALHANRLSYQACQGNGWTSCLETELSQPSPLLCGELWLWGALGQPPCVLPSLVVENRGAVCFRSASQTPLLSSSAWSNGSTCINRRRARMAIWKKGLCVEGVWDCFLAVWLPQHNVFQSSEQQATCVVISSEE